MDGQLSKREARFVKFYVETSNGADSARRAGYGHAGAHVQAHRLLRRDTVVDAIQTMRGKIGRHLEMNAQRTLQEVGRIADFDPIEVFDDDGQVKRVSDIQAGARRCIASISTKRVERPDGTVVVNSNVRFHDKLKALDMLAKSHGLYADDQPDQQQVATYQLPRIVIPHNGRDPVRPQRLALDHRNGSANEYVADATYPPSPTPDS